MRALGTSMLASAGVLGIVAGIAAQSTLGNLFAGLQIAFGDMVRIGDTVVVDGEWGTVEEITLTFLTVRTWDERRITMPVSYFTSKPFENWSRGGAQMTGTVFFHLDHSAPVEELRAAAAGDATGERRLGRAQPGAWWSPTPRPSTIEVRAAVTARDSDDLWTLRCAVRERLITWLQRRAPVRPAARHSPPAHRQGSDDGPAGEQRGGRAGSQADRLTGLGPRRAAHVELVQDAVHDLRVHARLAAGRQHLVPGRREQLALEPAHLLHPGRHAGRARSRRSSSTMSGEIRAPTS